MAVALEGHPDNVVPALVGGFTAALRCEEKVYYQHMEPPKSLCFQVAVPDFTLQTKVARNVLPSKVPLDDAVFNVGKTALLVAAIASGDLEAAGKAMDDKLHQPYRMDLVPGMTEVFAAAREAGALGVALSGSGPTVIALCCKSSPQVGWAMKNAFESSGIGCKVTELRPSQMGAVQLE
jgi:homoserine kinase